MTDRVYDISKHDFSEKTTIDFRIEVPNEVHNDLKSSATIEDGKIRDIELRLGLIPRYMYTKPEARKKLREALNETDIPKVVRVIPTRSWSDNANAKVTHHPSWHGDEYYGIHLVIKTGFALDCSLDKFIDFVSEYASNVEEVFEWEIPSNE